MTGATPSPRSICRCGHEIAWHDDSRDRCRYGEGTATGGCSCPAFHSRRWGTPKETAAPAPYKAPPIVIAFLELERKVLDAFGEFRSQLAGLEKAKPAAVAPSLRRDEPAPANGKWSPGKCERAILTVLSRRHPRPTTKKQLAAMADYSASSGGFRNALSTLRTHGLIADRGNALHITTEARAYVGAFEPLPIGPALLDYFAPLLGKCERAITDTLVAEYPKALDKMTLAEVTGYEPTSGGFRNALSHLRTLELVEGSREIRATEMLGYKP